VEKAVKKGVAWKEKTVWKEKTLEPVLQGVRVQKVQRQDNHK